MLLGHRDLTVQDADAVAAARATYRKRPSLGFSDCLVLELARKAGHLPLGSFDRVLVVGYFETSPSKSAAMSSTDQSRFVTPACIAGVQRSV